MIGMVLVTHGHLATEFRAALEHVVGPQKQIETITIGPEGDVDQNRAAVFAKKFTVEGREAPKIYHDFRKLLERPDIHIIVNTTPDHWHSLVNIAAAGKAPAIEYIDMPADLRDRYQYRTEARLDRLRAAGFGGHFTGLEEGVSDYVASSLSRPDPYL